jgi:hypothetical protein
MTWTNDIEGIKTSLADDPIKVGVNHDEAWAGAPMAQKPRLDVVVSDVSLQKNIVIQKNHGSSNIISSPPELLDGLQLLGREVVGRVEVDSMVKN